MPSPARSMSATRALVVFVSTALAACSSPPPDTAGSEPDEASGAALAEAEAAHVVEVGSEAANRLAGALMQHLTAALAEGGPTAAIDFCSARALALTDSVNAALEGVEVKRTSTRIRNPANRPDDLEAEALAWFANRITETGEVPEHMVQPVGDRTARFYRPLVANAMCVRCHGPADELDPAVRQALGQRYPDDEATGYAPGDLRGLIRVTVPLGPAGR